MTHHIHHLGNNSNDATNANNAKSAKLQGQVMNTSSQLLSYENLKLRANTFFKDQQFKQARLIYTQILTLLEKELISNGCSNFQFDMETRNNNHGKDNEVTTSMTTSMPSTTSKASMKSLRSDPKELGQDFTNTHYRCPSTSQFTAQSKQNLWTLLQKQCTSGNIEDLILVKLSIIYNNRSKVYLNLSHFSLAIVDALLSLEYIIELENICKDKNQFSQHDPTVQHDTTANSNSHQGSRESNGQDNIKIESNNEFDLGETILESYKFLLQKSKSYFSVAKGYFMLRWFEEAKENIIHSLNVLKILEKKYKNETVDHNISLCRKLLESINRGEENSKQSEGDLNPEEIHLDYKFIPYLRTHRFQFKNLHIQMLELNPDSPLQIRDSDELDREIYATHPIKKGVTIHREFASLVASYKVQICEQCGKLLDDELSVHSIQFCSRNCRQNASVWLVSTPSLHWQELINYSKRKKDTIPILVAKVIGEKLVYINNLTKEQLEKIVDLRDQQLDLTHLLSQVFPNQVPSATLQHLMNDYFLLRRLFSLNCRPTFDFEWYLAQYFTIACNTYQAKINPNDTDECISLLFTGFSAFFNHSNHPNAEFLALGNCIIFQSTKDVDADESITISYPNSLLYSQKFVNNKPA